MVSGVMKGVGVLVGSSVGSVVRVVTSDCDGSDTVNVYSPIYPDLSDILAWYSPGEGTGIVVENSPELSANPFFVMTCCGPYINSSGPKSRTVSTPSPIPLILPEMVNACAICWF